MDDWESFGGPRGRFRRLGVIWWASWTFSTIGRRFLSPNRSKRPFSSPNRLKRPSRARIGTPNRRFCPRRPFLSPNRRKRPRFGPVISSTVHSMDATRPERMRPGPNACDQARKEARRQKRLHRINGAALVFLVACQSRCALYENACRSACQRAYARLRVYSDRTSVYMLVISNSPVAPPLRSSIPSRSMKYMKLYPCSPGSR